jgi:hypothetical protein
VPFYAAGIWRTGRGRYAGRLIEIPVVLEGTRRQRIVATLANEARAYEELISQAPEQWTAIFFPIWPDLVAGAGTKDHSATDLTPDGATSAPPADAAAATAAAAEGAR